MHPQLHPRKPLNCVVRKYAKYAAIIVVSILATSCATKTPYTGAQVEDIELDTPDVSISDQATPLSERDINLERAEYYQFLAQNGDDTTSPIDARLSAAEYYIQANDYINAQRTLLELATIPLETTQLDRYDIVAAYIDYAQFDFSGALNRLSRVLTFSEEPINDQDDPIIKVAPPLSRQQIDALLLSSLCYQSLGDYDSAIAALVKREGALNGAARAETTRYTWQVINSILPEQRLILIENTQNAMVRNRLEQSLQGQVSQQTLSPQQFSQWREEPTIYQKQLLNDEWNSTSPSTIAVLLPITSRFNKAALALMDGIKHQHQQNTSPYRPLLQFYDIGQNQYQAPQYYQAAIQSGADFIIGPLGKEYAEQVNLYAQESVPTMLLGGESPVGGSLTRFTMSPENEGLKVAEQALKAGHLTAALLVPDTAVAQRTVNAFSNRWLQSGGKISKVVRYAVEQFDHSQQLKQLFDINQSEYRHRQLSRELGFKPKFSAYQRNDIDFIFMIADNDNGRIVRPQINFFSGSDIPVYSTSAIFNGIQDTINNMDLDRTHFPVMPWVLKSADVAPYAGQLNMLFAMGGDTYRVAGSYRSLRSDPNFAINGNTGQLNIDASSEITYQPIWAQFKNGEAVPMETLGIDLTPIEGHNSLNQRQENSDKKGVYNDSNWDHRRSRRKTGS